MESHILMDPGETKLQSEASYMYVSYPPWSVKAGQLALIWATTNVEAKYMFLALQLLCLTSPQPSNSLLVHRKLSDLQT